jgi:hypothetical protein
MFLEQARGKRNFSNHITQDALDETVPFTFRPLDLKEKVIKQQSSCGQKDGLIAELLLDRSISDIQKTQGNRQ